MTARDQRLLRLCDYANVAFQKAADALQRDDIIAFRVAHLEHQMVVAAYRALKAEA